MDGFVIFLFFVCALLIALFVTIVVTVPNPSRQQRIEQNHKWIDPVVVKWKDGTRTKCVIYKNSISCPVAER